MTFHDQMQARSEARAAEDRALGLRSGIGDEERARERRVVYVRRVIASLAGTITESQGNALYGHITDNEKDEEKIGAVLTEAVECDKQVAEHERAIADLRANDSARLRAVALGYLSTLLLKK